MAKGEKPEFLLGPMGIVLSLIFFPIGILVLLISTIIYLADWMCYNYGMNKLFCYLLAIILGPLFLPLVLISFLWEYLTRSEEVESRKASPSRKKASPSRKKISRSNA